MIFFNDMYTYESLHIYSKESYYFSLQRISNFWKLFESFRPIHSIWRLSTSGLLRICNLFIYKELKPYRTEPKFSLSQGCSHIVCLNGYITLPCISYNNIISEAIFGIQKIVTINSSLRIIILIIRPFKPHPSTHTSFRMQNFELITFIYH